VVIAWIYTNTKSLLLAQLLHVSSTGSLVVFSPARVTAAQETQWYCVYAAALFVVVAMIAAKYGKGLKETEMKERSAGSSFGREEI